MDDKKEQRHEFLNVLEYLDCELKEILENIDIELISKIEEIRLRVGKPLMICIGGEDLYIGKDSKSYKEINSKDIYMVNLENINSTFQKISNYSVYSIQEELKQGFITIRGGHRIGLIGKAIYNESKLISIKNISSINVRISKEIIGASNEVMKYVRKNLDCIYNTLIISPPKCGKTTMLRDIIRNISNGSKDRGIKGLKVGVVDERSELAAMHMGQPQNDLGLRTDILDACYKYDGMMILLRSMSPDVIATDEIGHSSDIKAIYEAMKSGVKVVSTAHGEDLEDIKNKLNLKDIIENKIFERIIILDNSKGVGTIKSVIDGRTQKPIKEIYKKR